MDPLAPYLDGLAAGELRTTRCTACATVAFPPRAVCAHCHTPGAVEWITASGRATVWSTCVFHKAYLPEPAPQPPYTVAVVQLDEGSQLVTNLLGEAPIGAPVEAVVDRTARLVRFRPLPA